MISRSAEMARTRGRLAREREVRELGQASLFGGEAGSPGITTPPPAPRRCSTVPNTSRRALDRVLSSGSASSKRARIVAAMATFTEPKTAAEIAQLAGLNRYDVSRRMKEIQALGVVRRCLIRACTVLGSECFTWAIT